MTKLELEEELQTLHEKYDELEAQNRELDALNVEMENKLADLEIDSPDPDLIDHKQNYYYQKRNNKELHDIKIYGRVLNDELQEIYTQIINDLAEIKYSAHVAK